MHRFRALSGVAVLSLGCLVALGCSSSLASEATGTSPGESQPSDVALEVQGGAVTLAEVDARIRRDAPATYQAIFDARAWAIDRIVEDRLIAEAAAVAGITGEELLRREVVEKADGDSDEAVALRRRTFVRELEAAADVTRLLEPPRYDIVVEAHERSVGPADAAVTIVEYSDFQCPFCQRVVPTLERVRQEYPNDVRLVYRDLPLTPDGDSRRGAEAGWCAHAQGGFWAFHDAAFENPELLAGEGLMELAGRIGLDVPEFQVCVDSRRLEAEVSRDERRGVELGIQGTPTFFINGRFLSGAQRFERFADLIDDELRRRESDR